MIYFAVAIVSLSLICYFFYSNCARKCLLQTPPGHLPLIGCVLTLGKLSENAAVWFYEWSVKFNFTPWECTAFGDLDFIVIQDSKQVEHMLKTNFTNYLNNTSIPGKSFAEIGAEFWGRGIFVVDGPEWETHRRASSHLFSLAALKNKMYHVFYQQTHKLIDVLNAQEGKEIDLQLLFQKLTFDVMCEIAFGASTDALGSASKPQFLTDFDCGQSHSGHRMNKPYFLWKAQRFFGLGTEPGFKSSTARMSVFCDEIIQRRRQAGDLEDRGDLLSMFIAYGRAKGQPELMTDAYLKDVIINFMVAGRDTTAATLTNMFRALSDNPAEGIKLREGLSSMSLCGDVPTDVATLMSQDCMRQVMYETFRLYPAVPVMSRFAINPDVMPGGVPVRSGALCVVPIISMTRNPRVWTEPLSFTPSRWKGRELPPDFEFPVFWGGPRVCLGRLMAQTQVMVVGGLVSRQFKLTIVGQENFSMEKGPVWFYREGLNVRVERI